MRAPLTDSQTAKVQALSLTKQMTEAFETGLYGASDELFEKNLLELMVLLKSRIAGITPQQRMDNPTHLLNDLLKLMSYDAFRNINQDHLRYQLARTLHYALDLVIIESYEEKWIDLSKTINTPHGEIEIMSIIHQFRRGQSSWERQYELDCCEENIRALLEKKKDWKKVLDIIKLAVQKNVVGLLQNANQLRQELPSLWQVTVLLLRRLTPLAQQSTQVLSILQQVMAEYCMKTEFHCHYAAQEALHDIIINSHGPEQAAIQKKALGQFVTAQEIKSIRQQPTLWYWVQSIRPTERQQVQILGQQIRGQEDRCRYRLIHSVGDILAGEMESKRSSDSETLLNAMLEMLIYLKDNEPNYLKESRAWIAALIEKIESDKPKEFCLKKFYQDNSDISRKHHEQDQRRIEAELKLLSLETQEQKKQLLEISQEKIKLEKSLQAFAIEKTEWRQKQSVLSEEKIKLEKSNATLNKNLEETKEVIASERRQFSREKIKLESLKQQLELSESIQRDLTQEISELRQKKSINSLPRINELSQELVDEKQKGDQCNQSHQKLAIDLQTRTRQLHQQEEQLAQEQKTLAMQQQKLVQKEQELNTNEKQINERQRTLDQQAAVLQHWEAHLRQQQTELDEQMSSLRQSHQDLRAREQIVMAQVEEIKLATVKLSPWSKPSSPPSFSIKPWPQEVFDKDFCEAASTLELENDFMCPVLKRPGYDMVTLKVAVVKSGHSEEHSLSDEAARHWLLEQKQTTCPCCRQPIQEVNIPRHTRAVIRDKIRDKISKLPAPAQKTPEPIAGEGLEKNIFVLFNQNLKQLKQMPMDMELQNQLIIACEQGDLKAVQLCIKNGAQAFHSNHQIKQPLAAAIWGMNPEVVDFLLTKIHGHSLDWAECETHNLRHYQKVFIFDEFNPRTYGEWHQHLLQMKSSMFLRSVQLTEVSKLTNGRVKEWPGLMTAVKQKNSHDKLYRAGGLDKFSDIYNTATLFINFKKAIKQAVSKMHQSAKLTIN